MKKIVLLSSAIICITAMSCRHHNNTSISYRDLDDYYIMDADFNPAKTRAVEYYMDRKLGVSSNMSFRNTFTNATLTLDDDTKFHLKKEPGHIRLKFNKDENSTDSYYRIKAVCEGMKQVLTK